MAQESLFITSVLIISIIIQVTVAFLALKLVRLTGRRAGWILLAVAIALMAVRRCLTLYHMFFAEAFFHPPDLMTELVALFSSSLMLAGVHWIKPLLESINEAQNILKKAHEELEARVKKRTAELAQANEQLQNEIFGHRLTEEALQESEAKHRTLIEQIPAITYRVSLVKANSLLYVSPQVEKILGFSSDEYKGSSNKWLKQIHQEDQDRVQSEMIASRVSGNPFACEYRVFAKDGSLRWFHDAATVVKDQKGRPLYLQGVVHDITEAKRSEELLRHSYEEMEKMVADRTAGLRRSNESLRAEIVERKRVQEALHYEQAKLLNILDSLEDGMCIMNKDFQIVYVNPSLRAQFGSHEGKKCYEYFHGRKDLCPWCDHQEVFKGKTLRKDWEFPANQKVYEIVVTPLINQDNEIQSLSIFHDMTTRQQAEEVLRRDKESFELLVGQKTEEVVNIQKQLEQSKRLSDLGMLAATVAHELRNPLGVIRTAVFNIRKKAQNPAIESNLANIEKKIAESDSIINNLLFYSRLKMPSLETVSPYEVLQESVASMKDRFRGWQVAVHTKLNAIRYDLVEADRLQIAEVFNNILSNAYEAFPEKKGKIEIRASKDGKGGIEIHFYDNGTGIGEEDLPKIFDPFYSDKSHGTGLGLTICKELIGLHNGTIALSSQKGKGTACTITLPLKSAAEK